MSKEKISMNFLNDAPQAGSDILNTEPPGAETAFYVICASIQIKLFSNNYLYMQGYPTFIFYQAEYEHLQYFSRNFYS